MNRYFKLNGKELTALEVKTIKKAAMVAKVDWKTICARPNESTLLLDSIKQTGGIKTGVELAIETLREHDRKIESRQRAVFEHIERIG